MAVRAEVVVEGILVEVVVEAAVAEGVMCAKGEILRLNHNPSTEELYVMSFSKFG